MMDIDEEMQVLSNNAQPSSSGATSSRRTFAPVDEDHPFDLEGYISNYTGRTAIDRLAHIISLCPSIAPEAFQLAIQHVHQSRDPALYQNILSVYEQLAAIPDLLAPLPSAGELAQLDTKWADEVLAKNQAEKMKLEVELKTYTNNMIKESIRMAHRDLGEFYRSTSEYTSALKHLTKSREFCATSQHVLDMCLSVLELLLEQRNYAHLPTYVFKAESALDALANSANTANDPTAQAGAASSNKKKLSAEKEAVQTKLDLATALSHLATGNYERASSHFLRLGSPSQLGDWVGKVITPGDIAIYGTLCALASLSRSQIKAQLLDSLTFSAYIEQEPYVRELITAYISSNFKTVLDILNKYSTRHLIDIHLCNHVAELTNLIRSSAVVLYFQPFETIKLDRMSKAFGWSVEEVEANVVQLIQAGKIQGRVDSQNKILYAKKTDYRGELFARAIQVGTQMQSANRKLLLRMKLQQAELVVKPPKNSQQNPQEISVRDG